MVQSLVKLGRADWWLQLQARPLFLLVPLYITFTITGWSSYFPWQSPISWFGLILIPFLCRAGRFSNSTARFYLYTAAFFILLTLILPVKTFLYFSLVFGVLFFIGTNFYDFGYLPLFTMIIISPICKYVTTVFTFPIRLQLTSIAAQILGFINPDISHSGNTIQFNGTDFLVDAECMGLSMVTIGLLTGVMLLNHYQRRTHSACAFLGSILFLTFVLLLLVVCNLFRIVFLVQFNIPPETLMHEVAGLLCFIVYVLFPATLLIQFLIKRKKNQYLKQIANKSSDILKTSISKNLILFVGLATITVYVKIKEIPPLTFPANKATIADYKLETINPGTMKLENGNSLVYIKKIDGFYSTEHSPMICWKGSGYSFSSIQRSTVSGTQVYLGKLTNKSEVLYTAWWFDNGDYRTINQIDWRWKVLCGEEEFSIVNVTTADQDELQKEVSKVLNAHTFRKLL